MDQGEILDVSAILSNSGVISAGQSSDSGSIQVQDSMGKLVAADSFNSAFYSCYPSSESRPKAAFRAQRAGDYTVTMTGVKSGEAFSATLRTVELDSTPDSKLDPNHFIADAAKLSYKGGGLYAFLDGHSGFLDISGPTGRGFQLRGNWQSSTAADGSVSYTATNTVGLVTPMGTVNLPLTALGSVVVTTAADSKSDGLYGEVESTQLQIAGLPVGSLMSSVGSEFSFSNNLNSLAQTTGGQANTPQFGWGIALGDTLGGPNGTLNDPVAPLNPAAPYLYFNGSAAVGYTYGQNQMSVNGTGQQFDAVVDPADPSFYLHVAGTPVVSDFTISGSWNGLIPFTPNNTITHLGQQQGFYGDLMVEAELDLGDLTDDLVPIQIQGALTFNLDPNHLGIVGAIRQDATDLLHVVEPLTSVSKPSSAALSKALGDMKAINVGFNGTGYVGVKQAGMTLELPLARATAVWNGQANTIAFDGQSVDPFSGTVVDKIIQHHSLAIDGLVDTTSGAFDVTATGTYTVFGKTLAQAEVEVSNSGITVTGSISDDSTIHIPDLTAWGGVNFAVTVQLGWDGVGTLAASGNIEGAALQGTRNLGSFHDSFSYTSSAVNLINAGETLWADLPDAASEMELVIEPIPQERNKLVQKGQSAYQSVKDYIHSVIDGF